MATFDEFANWLQDQLTQRGWDQAELARRGNISPAQVTRIMSGERRAGPDACRAIARALQLPPEEVFRQAGLLPKTRKVPEGVDDLVYYYTQLDREDRGRLLAVAKTFFAMNEQRMEKP
ncbi:MAG TPA: helix-turn-helix transcriptional regulator [Armatimonadota bacterium]|nr:helix-turn-helix transcriptional regulator [Armatimonadota bacterium]